MARPAPWPAADRADTPPHAARCRAAAASAPPPPECLKSWGVYRALTFKRWWVPTAAPISLLSCELDVRVDGKYRLVFGINGTEQQMEFFGRYIEVIPNSRIVWTNDEGDEEGAVTTVTFEERGDQTLVVVHDLYPSKEALDEAIASGSTEGMPAQLEQLDELVVTLVSKTSAA